MKKTGASQVAMPLGVAILVAGIGAGGWALLSQDDSTKNASESSILSSPAAAYVGNPNDVATWRLPLEAYQLTTEQTRTISSARDGLIDQCMDAAGYPQWTPAPDLPPLAGVSPMDSRYGIHNAQRAAKRGYHPDEATQKEYSAAVAVGAVDQSGSDAKVLRKCAGQADAKAPQAQRAEAVSKAEASSFLASKKDPAVLEVFAKWSACMKAKGYNYAAPMDAHEDVRFHDPSVVTELEIATATADVQCRTEHKVQKVWFDVETRLQQKAVKENQPAFEEAKKANQESVKKSSAVLGAR
ncbi:hypothetical protein ACFYYM_40470 [Streptomyces erythrochromogenes]|uniref:hypothetical protein n=1 Tax=Streptomyces erythrochromogenes TaxID=285574 RepID=UPI0036B19726